MAVTPSGTEAMSRWLARLAGVLVVLGGLVIVAGSLLPWSVGQDGPLFAFAWQGAGLAWSDNVLVLVAGLGMIVAGLVVVVGGVLSGQRPWLCTVTALACLVAGLLALAGFDRAVEEFGGFSHPPMARFGEHIDEKGVGIWFVLVGAAIGGFASLVRWGLSGRGTRAV